MATIMVYKVNYHFESAGKVVNHPQVKYVASNATDLPTIASVISAGAGGSGGGLTSHGGATLVIDSVVNAIGVSAQE